MKEVNAKLNSTTAGIAFSVNVVIYIFVSLLAQIIIRYIPSTSDASIYLGYLVAPVAMSVGCALTLAVRRQTLRGVVPVKCHFKYYIIALLMIFGLLFSVSKLNVVTLQLLKYLGYSEREQSSYLPSLEGGLIVPAMLVIAVLPALIEEFMFRGVLLNNLRFSVGDVRTVFIVGFCFSLFHTSPEQTVYQFICGCAFAFLALRSGSLLPGILMHFFNNGMIIILYACGAVDLNGNMPIPQTWNIVLTVLAAVAFVGSIIWLILDKKPVSKCEKGGVAKFFITASIGIFILAILWIASFVVK